MPPRPLYLYFHGAILSGWFVWLVVQAGLVWSGRTSTHRRAGWVGAAFGAMVVVASLMATLGLIPNLRSEGVNLDDPLPFVVIALDGSPFSSWIGFTSWIVWTSCEHPHFRRVRDSRDSSSSADRGAQTLDAARVHQHHRTTAGTDFKMAGLRRLRRCPHTLRWSCHSYLGARGA